MNYVAITLGFIALLIIYILYTFFFINSQLINNPVDLHQIKTELSYPATKLKNAGSTRYYYEAWFYIDDNQPQGSNNILFHRGDQFYLVLNGTSLAIYGNKTSLGTEVPNQVNVYVNSSDTKPILLITNTFPFQKWTQVVISVDGNQIDIYLDGQLLYTKQTSGFGTSSNLIKSDLGVGNYNTVGKLKKFVYKPVVASPQDVYNSYMREVSSAGLGGFFSSYGIDMSLLKDNENVFDLKLM